MEQSNNLRIRKSVSKAELKSRLYDKGISVQTMPSVKRPIPDNVRPYAAKLNHQGQNRPPVYGGPARTQSSLQQQPDDFHGSLTMKPSMTSLGHHPNLKSQSSEPFFHADRGQKSRNAETEAEDPIGGGHSQTLDAKNRPFTSTQDSAQFKGLTSSVGKTGSNPQFTTLNMAPYHRPQTQAFGFRGTTLQHDPSRKTMKASEEVTSITGLKTMTALGPSALARPKTGTQELLKKRSQSNKQMKRIIIGGKTEAEDKRKALVERIREEDDERKFIALNQSPTRKGNDKIVSGQQEYTDELMRSHHLMAKMRGKAETNLIERPNTTGYGFGNDRANSIIGQSAEKTSADQRKSQFKGGRTHLMGGSRTQDEILEQQEEDQEEETSRKQTKPKDSQVLDQTQSDNVITYFGKKQGPQKQQQTAKWNDLDKLITLLQNQPDDDGYFIYLKPSNKGDPYDLQPLIEADSTSKNSASTGAISKKTSQNLKADKFFTLSKKGITTYINDEPVEYISLTDWLIERNFYQQIREKRFFRQFARWKIVRMWRRNILQKKREEVKNNLTEKLFILDRVFGPILLDHRDVCKGMEKARIIDMNQPGQEALTLQDFAANQTKQRELVVTRIEEASETCRTKFTIGINEILEDLRRNLSEQNEDEEVQKKDYIRGGTSGDAAKEKKAVNSDPVFEQLGFKHNLKYGPRSKLRRACSRFLRFSYLLDFIALDALSNIYIKSVNKTIKKLKSLAEITVDFDLKPARQAMIAAPPSDGPPPKNAAKTSFQQRTKEIVLFQVNGVFDEIDIPYEQILEQLVPKFKPPLGQPMSDEEFFPTVHLELAQPMTEEEENAEEILADENATVARQWVENLNTHWLSISPQKGDFASLLNECFQEGLECLKHFERWSRHEDLLPYVKVLESWDDKVCDEWDPPDDNNLNCDEWLQDNKVFQEQSQRINELLTHAFDKVNLFFRQLEPFLQAYWENKKLGDFEILQDEHLHCPTDVIPLLFKRFNLQKDSFDSLIPQYRELGMVRINLNSIKNQLTPSPKECLKKLSKMLPSMVRRRIEELKQWLLQQGQSINTVPTNVESYVKQLQSLDYIDKTYQDKKDKIDLNAQIFYICQSFDVEKEDKNKKFNIQTITGPM